MSLKAPNLIKHRILKGERPRDISNNRLQIRDSHLNPLSNPSQVDTEYEKDQSFSVKLLNDEKQQNDSSRVKVRVSMKSKNSNESSKTILDDELPPQKPNLKPRFDNQIINLPKLALDSIQVTKRRLSFLH